MTFAEMRDRVLAIIAESGASSAYVTVDDVDKSINDGAEVIAEATEWYETFTPIPVKARQTYYDLRGLANAPVLTPRALQFPQGPNNAMTRWLRPVTVRDLDGEQLNPDIISYPRWETVQGLTVYLIIRGLFWLGVVPRSTSDSGVMRLNHTSIPRKLVEDDDTPDFPEEFQLGLVEYAAYDLFVQDYERGLALEHFEEYSRHETGLAAYVQERQSKDRILQMGPEQDL